MTTELKPCRVCEKKGHPECYTATSSFDNLPCHKVTCDCLTSVEAPTAKEAIERWNLLMAVPEQETLHDRYTMAALTGLCTNPMWDEDDFEKLAEVARLQADACMKARGT